MNSHIDRNFQLTNSFFIQHQRYSFIINLCKEMSIQEIHSFLTGNMISESSQILKLQLYNNSKNNRIYSKEEKDKKEGFILTCYDNPLYYANEPYFCPYGWRRYSLNLGLNNQQFSKKYQDWPVAYHGTSSAAAFSIFSNGFHSNPGCWIPKNEKAVYLTPSIVYASHPRYGKIQSWKNMYIQVVLQVRVKKDLFVKKPGTLKNSYPGCTQSIDPNYTNLELQWVCNWNKNTSIKANDGILVYGIMVRITHQHPKQMSINKWTRDD